MLLKEIKDILDEIKMIRAILAEQFEVFNDPELLPEVFREPKALLKGIDNTFSLMETHVKDVESGVSISTKR